MSFRALLGGVFGAALLKLLFRSNPRGGRKTCLPAGADEYHPDCAEIHDLLETIGSFHAFAHWIVDATWRLLTGCGYNTDLVVWDHDVSDATQCVTCEINVYHPQSEGVGDKALACIEFVLFPMGTDGNMDGFYEVCIGYLNAGIATDSIDSYANRSNYMRWLSRVLGTLREHPLMLGVTTSESES